MGDEDDMKRVAETEKRITALEKDNEHLKERLTVLTSAINTHRHIQERPLFDYVG